jgi:hypothetical protein
MFTTRFLLSALLAALCFLPRHSQADTKAFECFYRFLR